MRRRLVIAAALAAPFAASFRAANANGDQRLNNAQIEALVSGTKAEILGGTAWFNADGTFQHSSGANKNTWSVKNDKLHTTGARGGSFIITRKADGSYVFRKDPGGADQTIVFQRLQATR